MDQFSAVAWVDGKRELKTSGTLMECANWADNVIRSNGICRIDINIIRDGGDEDGRG